MASSELNILIISFIGMIILGAIFLFHFSRRKNTKIESLESILNEKKSNQSDQNNLQNLEKEYSEQLENARKTLNKEIFELQKDLFEKISKE